MTLFGAKDLFEGVVGFGVNKAHDANWFVG
jgi:hypothetical protein